MESSRTEGSSIESYTHELALLYKDNDGWLVPLLFNFALEYEMRKTDLDTSATIMNKFVQVTDADELNIILNSIVVANLNHPQTQSNL